MNATQAVTPAVTPVVETETNTDGMKTYTVVLSYFDADEYYTHFFLNVFLNHDKAIEYAGAMLGLYEADGIVECTDTEHEADKGHGNCYTTPILKIITRTH